MQTKYYSTETYALSRITPEIAFHYIENGIWTLEKFKEYMEAVVIVVSVSAAQKSIDVCTMEFAGMLIDMATGAPVTSSQEGAKSE